MTGYQAESKPDNKSGWNVFLTKIEGSGFIFVVSRVDLGERTCMFSLCKHN